MTGDTMVRIRTDNIFDHFQPEFVIALSEAIQKNMPNTPFDSTLVYYSFVSTLKSLCETWEEIPDNFIERT
jgi:hypothetical protein